MNSPVNGQFQINDHTVGRPDFFELDVNSDAYVWSGNPTLNYGTGKSWRLETQRVQPFIAILT